MKTAEYISDSNILKVKFRSFDKEEWRSILDFVKALPGREFIPEAKYWKVPALKENIEQLHQFGFDMIGINTGNPGEKKDETIPWETEKIDEELFPELRPYQINGLKFLQWRKGRGLICDQMGLGKTPQALCWLKMNPDKRPALIVVPASIKLQWEREFTKWTGDCNIGILSGMTPMPLNWDYSHIINWDILDAWKDELKKVPYQTIIGDEFQAIGNSGAKRTKAFKKLAKKIPYFIGLSGTPIRSRPAQFFNALSLCNPEQFSNEWKFKWRYCDPKSNGFGIEFKGASNIRELHELVSQVMIRRRKKDVLKDLPDKTRSVIPLPVTEMKSYQAKLDEFMNTQFARKLDQNRALAELNYTAFDDKKDIVVKWIEDFLDTGEKLVVFAWHRLVVDFLMKKFRGAAVEVSGGVSKQARDDAVQSFQYDDNIRLFVGNIVAAGVGIDGLQNVCSSGAFVELVFTPTDHAQAEDRLHRFGQNNPVNIYYLIAPGTVEEDLMEILDNKLKIIDSIVDGELPGEQDMYKALMERMKIVNK